MTIARLHPEELLDKEAHGTLSAIDRERLDAHLAQCPTCRFERQLRADFADDLSADISVPDMTLALAGGAHIDADAANENKEEVDDDQATERALESVRGLRTRRRMLPARTAWLIAVAALMVGGVAAAAAARETSLESGAASAREWIASIVFPSKPAANAATSKKHASHVADSSPSEAPIALPIPDAIQANVNPVNPPAIIVAAPSEPQAPRAIAIPIAHKVSSIADATLSTPIAHEITIAAAPSIAPPPAVVNEAGALFDESNVARRHGDLDRVVALHRELESRFPASRETQVSRATLGRWLLDRGDSSGALAYFGAYLAAGSGDLAEDAMIGRATALDRLGRDDEARRAWRSLLDAFPKTSYAAHAADRLASRDSHQGEAR
jgi:TolA-binding protein